MADFFDSDLPQDLEKLFADETALQQRGNDIDWTDIDRRLEEALQERLAPGTCLCRKTGQSQVVVTPTRRLRQKNNIFDSPGNANSPFPRNKKQCAEAASPVNALLA